MTRFSVFLAVGVSAIALASAVEAADLIIAEPAAPVVDVSAGSWDGFYLGAFTGFGMGEVNSPQSDVTYDLDGGWIGGVAAGVDVTVGDGVVVGIAVDAAYLGLDTVVVEEMGAVSYELLWGASLRGRLGLDGGAFLPYLTAGLAVAGAEVAGVDGVISGEDSNIHIGWTAGAGVEFAIADDVSLDLLYKYADYGAQEYTLEVNGPISADIGFVTHTVTAGLNWRF